MKERITITLEEDILKDVDLYVGKDHIKNRSHAVEVLLKKALGKRCPRKAVILCGGKGTRLRPITQEIPKPLIPVHGKPLVEHLIDLFKKYDIKDIVLSVGYKKEKIKEYFGNGQRVGVNISYIEESEESPLGTAGPLKKAREMFKESFIVTNGDELKDINLEEMYDIHKTNKSKITIALTTVADPSQYGCAELSGSRILRFIEKPPKDKAPSNLINSGLYIMEPDAIDLIPEGFAMLEKDVFPIVAYNGGLFGYPFTGQWYDTGNLERWERALNEWKGLKDD
ncbi:MAG TPA: sugar phosphate nucleotidyltransferase [Candidatus Nanoarchaeia archaeon]|nr:sugar phosphate nucleotidyltransferase [Candidatus Nanoarchaeia archaeon]